MPGKKVVLLAEDELTIRRLAALLLIRAGYTVLEANSTPDALKVAESYKGKIDVLVADVQMPGGASGMDLASKLELSRPDLKIILMSGVFDDSLRLYGWRFLQKPFPPALLVESVDVVLNGTTETNAEQAWK